MSNDVKQFYRRNSELNYPFISIPDNQDKVKSLFCDFNLSIVTQDINVLNDVKIDQLQFSVVGINFLVQVNSVTVLDTTTATVHSADYGDFRIYKYTEDGNIAQVVINKQSEVFTTDDYFSVSGSVRLSSRCLNILPKKVNSINNITTSPVFTAGYNINLVKTDNVIRIDAIPGAGSGRYNDVSNCPGDVVTSINGVGPINGNIDLVGRDCLWLSQENTTDTDCEETEADFFFSDNCEPCLLCDDIEGTYRALKTLYEGPGIGNSSVSSFKFVLPTNTGWSVVDGSDNGPPGAQYKYEYTNDFVLNSMWPLIPAGVTCEGVFGVEGNKTILDESHIIINRDGIWWMDCNDTPAQAFNSIKLYNSGVVNISTVTETLNNRYGEILGKYETILEWINVFKAELDKSRVLIDFDVNKEASAVTIIVKAFSGLTSDFDVNVDVTQSVESNNQAGKLDPKFVLLLDSSFVKRHNLEFEKLTDNVLIDVDGFDDIIERPRRFAVWVWSLEVDPDISNNDFGGGEAEVEMRLTVTANSGNCPEESPHGDNPRPSYVTKSIDITILVDEDGGVIFD